MLQLLVLLLLVPMSSCDAPSLSSHDPDLASHDPDLTSHDQSVSEEEYNAMKLLWEQKHKEVVDHQEVKRSKIKPSYVTDLDLNNHHLDMLDLSYHHHHVSHEQTEHHKTSHEKSATLDSSQVTTVERSRRQQLPDNHVGMASGSGSGLALRCVDLLEPSNGNFHNNGSIVTYMCEEGFVLVGNRQRFCNFTTGMWNGSDPTCEGPCTQDEPYDGSCDTQTSQYYYHMSQDRCLPFDGCSAVEDADNSYDSLMSCRDRCMASCNDSKGMMRLHQSVWTTTDCQLCHCVNGIVTCDPMDLMECPALFCGEDEPITIVEGCCPVCPTGPCTQDEPYDGSCDTQTSQYYYHMSQDRCLPFDGCSAVEDADNSYDSLMSCRDRCMASCNDSKGMMRLHRSVWATTDCQLCNCTNGIVTCDLMDLMECPTLFCGEDEPITLVEGCCPVCPTESCNTTDGIRLHNDTWSTDECQQCLCTNGRVTCSPPDTPSESCDPVDDCSNGIIVVNSDTMCCPVCRPNITEGACEADNITYYDGEIFMKDLCTMCQCNNEIINCTVETCPQCDKGTTAVNVSNQCCPECQNLTSCELMENKPARITLFDMCHSIHPVVKHSCPEQCRDEGDIITRCCITTYFSNSTQFECVDMPGFPTELKFLDANECTCEPCG